LNFPMIPALLCACLWLFGLVSWGFKQATTKARRKKLGVGIGPWENLPEEVTVGRYPKNVLLRVLVVI
jgi:hypothetical protein